METPKCRKTSQILQKRHNMDRKLTICKSNLNIYSIETMFWMSKNQGKSLFSFRNITFISFCDKTYMRCTYWCILIQPTVVSQDGLFLFLKFVWSLRRKNWNPQTSGCCWSAAIHFLLYSLWLRPMVCHVCQPSHNKTLWLHDFLICCRFMDHRGRQESCNLFQVLEK